MDAYIYIYIYIHIYLYIYVYIYTERNVYISGDIFIYSEDCFYYCSERNNVVVLFGTLKVQSFILTEVSDCGLLIVVTSSTFLKRKDMLKEKSS